MTQSGSKHHQWKGDTATPSAGRSRAERTIPMGVCELCGKPGEDRHHKDDNPLNNEANNVQLLCRACHMRVDGRIKRLVAWRYTVIRQRNCNHCERSYKPLRKGLCNACYKYVRAHGSLPTILQPIKVCDNIRTS